MSSKKSTIAIIVLSVALVLSWFRGCEPEADWLVKPDDPNRLAIWEGYAVSSGLFLYAEKNGRLPRSLDELKPDYIGAAVDLSHYAFTQRLGGTTNWGKWDVIAARKMTTPDGDTRVCIPGHGHVYVPRPGD